MFLKRVIIKQNNKCVLIILYNHLKNNKKDILKSYLINN